MAKARVIRIRWQQGMRAGRVRGHGVQMPSGMMDATRNKINATAPAVGSVVPLTGHPLLLASAHVIPFSLTNWQAKPYYRREQD